MEEQEPKQKILGTKILKYLKQKIAYMLANKQDTLISGQNIKTINGEDLLDKGDIKLKTINNTSIVGSGNIDVQPKLVSGTNIKTINNKTILGSGDLEIDANATLYSDWGSNVDGAITQKFLSNELRGTRVRIGDTSQSVAGAVAVGPVAQAKGVNSVAVGRDATTEEQGHAVAVGPKTTAETGGSVALGYDITSGTGTGSIAVGYQARGSTLPASTEEETSTDATIAIGFNANAADQAAIAFGNDAEARFQCMAIGNNLTKARGRRNIAIGAQAEATAESGEDSDGAIAMGILSRATGAHGIAVGYGAKASERNTVSMSLNAEASKEGAVAIGTNSTASNQFSVALGHSSQTADDYTVSVGHPTLKRRITNVAPAVNDDDAVTKKQLDAAVGGGSSGGAITYYQGFLERDYNVSYSSSFQTVQVSKLTDIPAGIYYLSTGMELQAKSGTSSWVDNIGVYTHINDNIPANHAAKWQTAVAIPPYPALTTYNRSGVVAINGTSSTVCVAVSCAYREFVIKHAWVTLLKIG